MTGILIQNLTFAHPGAAEPLFRNLTLSLDSSWRLGLIGRNGLGKTTLLNLLMNRHEYRGTISLSEEPDYFPYDLPHPERPSAEALAQVGDFETWRLKKELARLKAGPEVLERPFLSLSGGERTKVLLAALFSREGRFPLIDEPTNHLDLEGRRVVGEYLARQPGFILVSHDRAFLDLAVDHVLALSRAGVDLQQGNYTSWRQNQDYQDQFEAARSRKLTGEIKKLGQAARRSADWSERAERGKFGAGPVDRGFVGAKAAKIMKRSLAADRRRERDVDEKKSLLSHLETRDRLALATESHHASRLLTLTGLSVSFGPQEVLKDLDLSLDPGERLAVMGPNGSGKTTLLKLAAGLDIPYQGLLSRASGLTVSWLPQDLDLPGTGNLKSWIRDQGLDESRFKAILHKLGLDKTQFDTPLAAFSWGQKKKILLAGALVRPAHLHIWDEPLNYIDLISRV